MAAHISNLMLACAGRHFPKAAISIAPLLLCPPRPARIATNSTPRPVAHASSHALTCAAHDHHQNTPLWQWFLCSRHFMSREDQLETQWDEKRFLFSLLFRFLCWFATVTLLCLFFVSFRVVFVQFLFRCVLGGKFVFAFKASYLS